MTFMALLLLIILFFVFFIYFSGLNPHEVTVFFYGDHALTYPVAIVVVACILAGLILGYGAHLYGTVTHLLKHWKRDRAEKRTREISAIYREGVGRLLSGDVKKARALLQKALERDRSRIETYIALASVRVQEGSPQDGVSLLQKAREIEPSSLEVLFKMTSIYQEMGLDDDAVRAYQDILAIEKDNRKALRALRDLHMRHSRWEQALEMQKQVLKAGPSQARIEEEKRTLLSLRYEVASRSLMAGETDKAKQELKEILRQDAGFIPAIVSLGDVKCTENANEEAARIWQDGYRRHRKSVFLARLEDLYLQMEDPTGLISFYRAALNENSDDLMLRFFFGRLCLRLEMVDEALENLYAVESSGAESSQLHLLLAEAHRRRKRTDEAIEQYQKALGVDARLSLKYICDSCGHSSAGWLSRCPQCGSWGSYSLAGQSSISEARPVEARAIHHGERK